MYRCPICDKHHNNSIIEKCECGFGDYNYNDNEDELLFNII